MPILPISDISLCVALLSFILISIFYLARFRFFKRLYAFVPPIVFCCFIPATLNTFGLFDAHTTQKIYAFCAQWFLPCALFLMSVTVDFVYLIRLGWKILAMFLAATVSIVISAPIVLYVYRLIFSDHFPNDELWRGLSSIAASWSGGAVNQAAMKPLFNIPDNLFATMILVDAFCASLSLFFIFLLSKHTAKIDSLLHADTQAISDLIEHANAQKSRVKVADHSMQNYLYLIGTALTASGLSMFVAKFIAQYFDQFSWAQSYSLNNAFLWGILLTSLLGIIASFTRFRQLEAAGASQMGTALIYYLIAVIGMQINLSGIGQNLSLVAFGTAWIILHWVMIFAFARVIRAPFAFIAIASNANTGGASSAPIVASIFHPALAPVGVILGIFSYTIGTVAGYVCAQIMRLISL